MRKIISILICLILVVALFIAFMPSIHPGGSTQGDMPAVAVAAVPEPLPAADNLLLSASSALNDENNNYMYVYCGAILLTAMEVVVVARKRFTQWKTSALRLYTSLKARVRGALAAGDQLKFPLFLGC